MKGESLVTVSTAASRVRGIILLSVATVFGSYAHADSSSVDLVSSDKNEIVNVVLKEWYILPDKRTVDESNIMFKVVNQGKVDHEFIIIKTDLSLDAMPVHEKGLNEKEAGIKMAEIEDIRPGESRELAIDMPPGKYVLFCNRVEIEDHKIVSHYRHGMRIVFTVKSDKD